MGERRKRTSPADSAHFIGILNALAIEADRETDAQANSATLALARIYDLTLYDGAYLELAIRRNLPLATLDHKLRSAARRFGIKCLPKKI